MRRDRVKRLPVVVGTLVAMLCASTGFAASLLDSRILFARDTSVPRPVQDFAWQVIATGCNYQRYEREQRSFWAYNAQATKVDGGVAYSIGILAAVPWKQAQPAAVIEMSIVNDGRPRLTALKSTFVQCRFPPP